MKTIVSLSIYGVIGLILVLALQLGVPWLLGIIGTPVDAIVAYSGSIVIGFIALYTLIVTTINSANAQKTSCMPFILMDFGNKDTSENIIHSDGAFQVTLQSDNSASPSLPEITSSLINHSGWAIYLKNIGNGTAHNISLKVNKDEIFSSRVLEKGQILSGYCYVPNNMWKIDMHVVLTFQDMMNNQYKQQHTYVKHPVCSPKISLGKPLG